MSKELSPMPRIVLALIASMVTMSIPAHAAEAVQPRLVVGIMVDGLEREYLDLLRTKFTSGGFNRLMNNSVEISNADYGTSVDAVAATAMVMTGTSPSVSGVPGAESYDRVAFRTVPIFNDSQTLGNFTNETYSPRALAVSTIADELRIAGDGTSNVYALAADPEQAIALAGHSANCGLWINSTTGNWATTVFYKDLPACVASRNRAKPLTSRLDTMVWTPSLAASDYPAIPEHLKHYSFKYVFPRGNNNQRIHMFMESPMLNTEVTDLASELITTLNLGKHEGADMVNVAYNLQPYSYAKTSDSRFELLDSYIKLDRNLERLFSTIDRTAGSNGAVIFLAATPASSRTRRDEERWEIPYGEFSTRKAMSLLNMYLIAIHGNGDWVTAYHNKQFYFNQKLLKDRNIDVRSLRVEAADFLARMSGVRQAFTIDDIIDGKAGENAVALRRNTSIAHSGDIVIDIIPGWEIVDDFNTIPTTKRIRMVERSVATTAPVFIMAPEVNPRRIDTPTDIRVIAPTVTRLLRIRSPNAAATAPLQLR
jgi:hypothetical protein